MSILNKIYIIYLLIFSVVFAQSVKVGNIGNIVVDSKYQIKDCKVEIAENWENKISPIIKMKYNEFQKLRTKENFSSDEFIVNSKLISLQKYNLNDISIPVIIKVNNPELAKEKILKYNGIFQTQIGSILTVELPLENIINLAKVSEIDFIDASYYRQAYLNTSRAECKADAVHLGTGLPQAYKGSGVVAGVLDSGIDWKHNDFKDANGSRIRFLWDMSSTINPPSGYNYGTEYTKAQLDLGQCQEVDDISGYGHGTHVASTTAGNGNSIGNYVGIAPESDIIFVKGFRNSASFADADVVNGCNYIFNKAQQLNKPCAINLSLGGHFGPHDGTSLYEQALSNLTGNGKIISVAAGNEGDSYIHLSYTTGGVNLSQARQSFWLIDNGASIAAVDMWYNQPGQIYVGIAAYNQNFQQIGYTQPVGVGQKIEDLAFTVNNFTYGYVTIDATTIADPNNNARRVVFVLDSHNGAVSLNNCYWVIYTYGSGKFDAWSVVGGKFSTDNNPPTLYPGDNNTIIGIPSTAMKVICVGSYVTKNLWVDIDGITRAQPGNPPLQQLSSFSNVGPTRDGRLKPDLTAPGEVIVAALSSDLPVGNNGIPRAFIVQGGKHQKMQGTSMATPHVNGAIALMLQRNKNLNYQQVFNILTTSTKKDSYTGQTANNYYGYGKLDVLKSLQNTPTNLSDETLIPSFNLSQNYPNPFNPSTIIEYQIPQLSVVTLKIYDALGRELETPINEMKSPGKYYFEWNAKNYSTGIYFYELKTGNYHSVKKMILVK